jgi:hypothetical protein
MSQTKQDSKRKHRACALPVLGAAGLSLSLASGASAVPGGPTADMPTPNTEVGQEITLGEEEIADVSLATFYVFDKESPGTLRPGIQLARHGGGGCGGCGGHGRGCGGCGGHGHGCGGCGGHWGWGGCIGIGIGCGGGGYWCWINGVRTWCPYDYYGY